MEYKFISDINKNSSFIKEDYFPAIIEYSSEELNNYFIEFNYKDTDMFELSVNPETKELKRFTLTLCNHFSVENTNLPIPNFTEGSISISGPQKTECNTFSVKVYTDGILIETSVNKATKYLKCGQLIFALSPSDEVVSLYVTNLSSTEIEHVVSELNA